MASQSGNASTTQALSPTLSVIYLTTDNSQLSHVTVQCALPSLPSIYSAALTTVYYPRPPFQELLNNLCQGHHVRITVEYGTNNVVTSFTWTLIAGMNAFPNPPGPEHTDQPTA
jgi:hypothetical protein